MPPDILLGPNEVFTYPLPHIQAGDVSALEKTYSEKPFGLRNWMVEQIDHVAVQAGLLVAQSYINPDQHKPDEFYKSMGLVFDKLSMLHVLLGRAQTPDKQLVSFSEAAIKEPDSAFRQSIRQYGEYELWGPERLDAVKGFVAPNDPVMFDMIEKGLGSPATQEDSRIARLGCYGMVGLLVEYAWLDAAIR